MSQNNIDFGTFPDDPSADAIRTAFNKVQNNFNQLFSANANSAVTSVNRTAGAGITVNYPTGNVIVSANIACVQVSTSSLSIGTGSNGGSNTTITQSSQTLVVDINPAQVYSNYFADVGNGLTSFNGVLTSTSNAQPNVTSLGNLTGLTVSNASGNVIFVNTANVSLGSISNLHIDGGTNGYALVTNGAGNLIWAAAALGPTGATGATGATGYIGSTGATGYIGTTGATGATGATGYIGTTGATGATGYIGTTGATGYVGTTGATGATGYIGTTGATGATGYVGTTGATGYVGTTGATGYIGTTGATGATGYVGTTGATGATGATGYIGTTGATGATGYIGTTGATGATGLGAPGATGEIGSTGATGAIGATGATGLGATGATGPGDKFSTTSSTSLTISIASKTLTIGLNLSYIPAQTIIISYDGSNYMDGEVTSYDSATGVMIANVTSITGTGTYSSWYVNLSGAVGLPGSTGLTGATGYIGTTGATGATGATGLQGATGEGATGATGATGYIGTTGATGATGLQGATGLGATGATGYIGTTGATGATGYTGTTGATGATGAIGATGATGYIGTTGATGATGYIGTTGATGATGYVGTTGATGATGVRGTTGATGATGTTGATGYIGTTGATGATGYIGTTGATGATGYIGTTGATGATGATGIQGATGAGATGASGVSDKFSTTSVTTLSITIASKSLTIGLGLSYTPGQSVIISYDGSNFMSGSVTSYNSSTGAMVANITSNTGSGTYSPWSVNLSGSVGQQGATGYTGATGATGAGATGTTGATGYIGTTGATGATGYIGTTGATGATGYIGTTGATGATGLGATGATGYIGTTGATGATGYIGATGATGATGIQGTTGATGATGYIGATGATGATGLGATGATGYIGSTGATGATGIIGGANTQVLFNDALASNGSANFTFNKTTNVLTLSGTVSATNYTGTLTTAAQPNITSVGTLTGLTLSNAAVISVGSNTNVGTFTGNWSLSAGSKLNATYADLAEYYAGSEQIEPGTVVEFGGEHEVQICNSYMSTLVAGIVTTNPAYLMNSEMDCLYPVAVALQGRVPSKVIGPIKRGDLMVSTNNGYAISCTSPTMGTVLGKALKDFDGTTGIIEIMVGRT